MKGLCKTECGMTVEYVPHEFSDGFVYYLPRNLDGTVHNCIFSEEEPDFFDIEAEGWRSFRVDSVDAIESAAFAKEL